MTTLDPRGLEAAIHAVKGEGLTPDGGTPHGWRCEHPDRYPDYCKCPTEMAESAVTAYLAVTRPVVETVEELEGLPARTIIVDATGRARRWEGEYWTDATTESYTHEGLEHWGKLPARVIWRPHESA